MTNLTGLTLVDTSVWIDHFRGSNADLAVLLEKNAVAIHPLVICELACGQLPKREQTLTDLESLPQVLPVPDSLIRESLETHRWYGKGISWIDAHLLVAARAEGMQLWTFDRQLQRLAGGPPPPWVH